MRFGATCAWIGSVLLLAACGSSSSDGTLAPQGSIPSATFTVTGGCGNVVLYARNADGSMELAFFAVTAINRAVDAGGRVTLTFDLPDPEARLQLLSGQALILQCGDVLPQGTRIDHTFRVISGRAVLVVDVAPPAESLKTVDGARNHDLTGVVFDSGPGSGGAPPPPAFATLHLEDVVLRADDGLEVTIDVLDIEDVAVGF